MIAAFLLAALLLAVPADAVNVPPAMLRIEKAATVYRPAVRVDAAPCDVPCIIAAVFPPDLAPHALRIAWRESRWLPWVHTSCCFGVFEIHRMHLAWLCPEMGICSVADLYDPRLNAEAAYALYLRDGWAPWAA